MIVNEALFDEVYETWFSQHLNQSTGERRQRLEEKRRKEEENQEDSSEKLLLRNVWWPVYGSLDHVYPEYEVVDFNGKTRFLDEAYIPFPLLIDLEVDGYGPHSKNISRWEFSDERRRDTCLEIIGWNIIRFSFDDVKKNKLECQYFLKHWMARWTGEQQTNESLDLRMKEILKFAAGRNADITLSDVKSLSSVSDTTARKLLRELLSKQLLIPSKGSAQRIQGYRLNPKHRQK